MMQPRKLLSPVEKPMAERSRSDTIQLKARMKEPLRAKLEAAAKARGVSLNAEMIHRLERSFIEEEILRWAWEKIASRPRSRM